MKHLSLADRKRHNRKRDRLAKKLIKASRARKPRKDKNEGSHIPALRLVAPLVFDCRIPHNRRMLVEFLKSLRYHFRDRSHRTLLIDFTNTKQFIADATLLFYAELTRLVNYREHTVVRCTKPRNNRASQVLEQIGVYKLCRHPSHGKPNLSDVVDWRVARGHQIETELCATKIDIYDGQVAKPLLNGLLGGLNEAMTNAGQHAYDQVRDDGLDYTGVRDWWMFSQAKDGYLSVVLCDLGIGIPRTLPIKRPWLIQQMMNLGLKITDTECIEGAIKESRSQTKQPERGKGLGNIIRVVEQVPDGIVFVSSNRGHYGFMNGKANSVNYGDSIMGTLISWRVPFTETSTSSEA